MISAARLVARSNIAPRVVTALGSTRSMAIGGDFGSKVRHYFLMFTPVSQLLRPIYVSVMSGGYAAVTNNYDTILNLLATIVKVAINFNEKHYHLT